MKRVAIIGMSGNSLFYNNINNEYKLVHEEVGGKGYNQAIACIRNGVNVSYLTAVGNDEEGLILENYMKKEGIDTFFVKKKEPTLVAKIYVDESGDNKVEYNYYKNSILDEDDVLGFEEEIKRSDCLIMQYEYPLEVIKKGIELCKKHNKMLVINPAPTKYDDIDIVKNADFITPNKEESMYLFLKNRKYSKSKLIKEEKKSGIKCIINTLGKDGILLVNQSEYKEYSSIDVNAVDTTGAGDTFNGVFVATYLITNDLDYSIQRGVIASGLSVTKHYVMNAIPSNIEIDDYINNLK